MFKQDNPISKLKDDENGLHRANFSNNLALNIKNYFNMHSTNDCLTIGLMGEWGSGKTSILNLTENELKKTDIKIIKFNPWIYSSYNQLIELFFDELIYSFYKKDENTLKNYFRQYKLKLNELSFFKNLTITGASFINPKIGDLTEKILKTKSEEKSLEYIKNKINHEIKNHKILCIIDDVDRLSNNEIAEIFKLVKVMANFDNMVYLISFDENVVSKALQRDYGGEDYIEKIINIPLYVPAITTDELMENLLGEVKRIANEYNINVNESRLYDFLNPYPLANNEKFGLINYFKNLRDIKRFINILEFNLILIKEEVEFVDFFVITALQVFNLNIYKKIKNNEFLLINNDYYKNNDTSKNKITQSKIKDFENLCNDEKIVNILKQLFPLMRFIYKPNHYILDYEKYDEQLLICHPNHFQTYFKLNEYIKDITEREINEIISLINNKYDLNSIFNHFKEMSDKKFALFLRYMLNRLNRLLEYDYFLKILFSLDKIDDEKYWYNIVYINKLVINLCYKIKKSNRFDILKDIYADSENLSLLYDTVNFIENNNTNIYVENEKLLELNEINYLKEMLKEKFNNMDTNNKWDNQTKFRKMLIICEDYGLEKRMLK